MKISGTFTIKKTNILTNEESEISKGNIITNNYYNLLQDGSNKSIGFYLWTSPYETIPSRRRMTISSSENFLNSSYPYMTSTDWYARYVLAEENQPGYFETRARLDPPNSGTRTIKSVLMTNRQPRTDNVTGLLPDHPENTIIDSSNLNYNITLTKSEIFAYISLEEACIQSDIEIYDIYYRLVFDNNYANVNLSETAIELLGKQSTAKMPCIQRNGNLILSTSVDIPAMSNYGPINFVATNLREASISIPSGEYWDDYSNLSESEVSGNEYIRTYTLYASKDSHVGKIFNTLSLTGVNNSASILSGYRSIYNEGYPTIGNTHSHSNVSLYPYFNPTTLTTGLGYCDIESVVKPLFPEFIEVDIKNGGTVQTAKYTLSVSNFTGTYKNTYNPLPIDIPHLSQLIINNGNWRYGLTYNSYDYAHGFLTGKAGTHPSLTGIAYNQSSNPYPYLSRISIESYSGIREYSEYELLGFDKEGISIFRLDGAMRTINKYKSNSFIPQNIIQVSIDNDTLDLYVACNTTGIYKLNSQLTTVSKINPNSTITNEPCYGIDIYNNKIITLTNSGIYYSEDMGSSWQFYSHPDYISNGLDKTKIVGIRADLTSITPNLFILFSNHDNDFTTSKKDIIGAWWSPTIFNTYTTELASLHSGAVSPSFLGIEYVRFNVGTFYFTYHGKDSNQSSTVITKSIFNTSATEDIFTFQNTRIEQIPKIFRLKNKDYIIGISHSSIILYNLTDDTIEETIGSYGQHWATNMVSMNNVDMYYGYAMKNGLILYRGTTTFTQSIYSQPGYSIRNNSINEDSSLTITKIINPFFGKQSWSKFKKIYGWDTIRFTEETNNPKEISDGVNSFNGLNLIFTGQNNQNDFIANEKFTTVRIGGIHKDNASLFRAFLSNSNYIKSETKIQNGLITPSTLFYKLGMFEHEESDIIYTEDTFKVKSSISNYDYFKTAKIPQEAGTMRFKIKNDLSSGYSVSFSPSENVGGYNTIQFGIIIYKSGSQYFIRIAEGAPSYERYAQIKNRPGYSPIEVLNNDIIEIGWTTGTTTRAFTLKVNGSIVFNGGNFDSNAKNSSKLILYYSVMTESYPTLNDEIIIQKPEFRWDSTSTIINIPLGEYLLDKNGLSVNGDNFGINGDMNIIINNTNVENLGVKVPEVVNNVIQYSPRTIISNSYAVDNKSGSILFSKYDENKTYSITYVYYKDTD